MVTLWEDVKGDGMTNKEKFIETFGFEPDMTSCVLPRAVCEETRRNNPDVKQKLCWVCPFYDWFNKEYKECFRMRGDL